MDWYLLLLSLWLCVILGTSENSDQRFYLMVTENDDKNIDLTLEQCKNPDCLRRGQQEPSDLKCMCEDNYREAERRRAECGDGGRNVSAVQLLEAKNRPEKLGLCAGAFANLGYLVETVNSSESHGYYSDSELETKISEITEYATEFWSLLDRTLVGVYLSSDQQRNICKDAYNEWLCSISLSLYSTNVSEIKPCLSVCTRVVQQCPYYLPSKFQENASDEVIYGGYPVFDCPDIRILREYEKKIKSCVNSTCQAIPYGLEKKSCITRDADSHNLSHPVLILLLSIIATWML